MALKHTNHLTSHFVKREYCANWFPHTQINFSRGGEAERSAMGTGLKCACSPLVAIQNNQEIYKGLHFNELNCFFKSFMWGWSWLSLWRKFTTSIFNKPSTITSFIIPSLESNNGQNFLCRILWCEVILSSSIPRIGQTNNPETSTSKNLRFPLATICICGMKNFIEYQYFSGTISKLDIPE